MKRVAALLAATVTLGVTACTVDEHVVAAEVSRNGAAGAEPGPAAGSQQTGRNGGTASREALQEEPVRDAKEAVEDAARRFFDATREAAERIKGAGKQAAASDGAVEPDEESN